MKGLRQRAARRTERGKPGSRVETERASPGYEGERGQTGGGTAERALSREEQSIRVAERERERERKREGGREGGKKRGPIAELGADRLDTVLGCWNRVV